MADKYPFSEKLPTLDEIYEWLPKGLRAMDIPYCMRALDEIYAVFSSLHVTGERKTGIK